MIYHSITPAFEHLFTLVDYKDLSRIAMKLYEAGVEEVSSTAMLKNTLRYNSKEKVLEVCEYIILLIYIYL